MWLEKDPGPFAAMPRVSPHWQLRILSPGPRRAGPPSRVCATFSGSSWPAPSLWTVVTAKGRALMGRAGCARGGREEWGEGSGIGTHCGSVFRRGGGESGREAGRQRPQTTLAGSPRTRCPPRWPRAGRRRDAGDARGDCGRRPGLSPRRYVPPPPMPRASLLPLATVVRRLPPRGPASTRRRCGHPAPGAGGAGAGSGPSRCVTAAGRRGSGEAAGRDVSACGCRRV